MSKQTLCILGILAVLILGALFYPNKCCSDCYINKSENSEVFSTKKKKTENHNSFKINGNDFSYSCKENFSF